MLASVPEAAVVGALVGPDDVLEAVLSAAAVAAAIGEEHGGAAHPEVAIGDEHGSVLPRVPIEPHHLRAHHDGVVVRVCLQHVPRQIEGDYAGAAPHPPQIEAQDVAAHLVVVDDHGGERRRGVEEAAVEDEDADILGAEVSLLEELVQRPEDDGGGLRAPFLHGGRVLRRPDGFGGVGFVAEAGGVEDSLLKFEACFVEFAGFSC